MHLSERFDLSSAPRNGRAIAGSARVFRKADGVLFYTLQLLSESLGKLSGLACRLDCLFGSPRRLPPHPLGHVTRTIGPHTPSARRSDHRRVQGGSSLGITITREIDARCRPWCDRSEAALSMRSRRALVKALKLVVTPFRCLPCPAVAPRCDMIFALSGADRASSLCSIGGIGQPLCLVAGCACTWLVSSWVLWRRRLRPCWYRPSAWRWQLSGHGTRSVGGDPGNVWQMETLSWRPGSRLHQAARNGRINSDVRVPWSGRVS